MAFFKSKSEQTAGLVDMAHLPRHIAIIMDGNGRWAKRRALPRTAGHKVGAEVFRTIATYCKDLGIEYLTAVSYTHLEKNTNVPVLALRGLTIFPNMLMHFDVERDISVKALEAAIDVYKRQLCRRLWTS